MGFSAFQCGCLAATHRAAQVGARGGFRRPAGRLGTAFGPFLYAMVLTRGEADHPAFASLPPPNPKAHLH